MLTAKGLKGSAISIFSDGGFQLHNQHSNAPEPKLDSHKLPTESENN